MTDTLLDTFADSDLVRAERNAWRESARSWSEYHAADRERGTSDDARWLAQTLNESAWSAHHHWARLHDALTARNLRIDR